MLWKLGTESFSSVLPLVAALRLRELNTIYKVLIYKIPFPRFYEAGYGSLLALNVLNLATVNFKPSVGLCFVPPCLVMRLFPLVMIFCDLALILAYL